MTSHVEEQIQRRIAEAKRRREQRRLQRAELAEARTYGLQARMAAKLARWVEDDE